MGCNRMVAAHFIYIRVFRIIRYFSNLWFN